MPYEKLSSYGIIKGRALDDSLYVLEDIVEKPSPEFAPSNRGAIGRYVFTPEIFDCIKEAGTGVGSEIQLTDGIRLLNKTQMIYACRFKGTRFDTGGRLGYVKSIVDFALKNENLRDDVLSTCGKSWELKRFRQKRKSKGNKKLDYKRKEMDAKRSIL